MRINSKLIGYFRVLPLIIFVGSWEMLVAGNERQAFFFGQPSKIVEYIWVRSVDGSLWVDFFTTFSEAAIGFIIGNIVGTISGLGLWYSKSAFEIARPYIVGLGSAPIFAFAPILVIWFGTGMFSKVMIAALSTVFIALLQSYTGADDVREDHLRLMKSFGATKSQTFRKVVAPSSVVWVMSAFKMNVGFAILGAFIGEFISSSNGLGHMILVASGLFDISLMLTGILMLILIALILTWLVGQLEPYLKHKIVKNL